MHSTRSILSSRFPIILAMGFIWTSTISSRVHAQQSPAAQPVVSLHKMNIVYRGVGNPMSVAVAGIPHDQLRVRATNGHQLDSIAPGEYMLYPKSAASVEIITEHIQPDGIHQELDRRYFRNLPIPDPQPQFGGKSIQDTCISLVVAQNTPAVGATLHNFEWDVPLEVTSFILVLKTGNRIIMKMAHSARLTADQKLLLKSAKVGDLLALEDIVIALPDGSQRALAHLKFRVTL